MKLKLIAVESILNEGIYLNPQHGMGPSALTAAKAENKTPEMFMKPEYLHRSDDRPEDIVHLDTISKTDPLPQLVDVDPHQLSGFKGAKIFYAFAVVPADNWEETASGETNVDYSDIVGDAADATEIYSDDTIADIEEKLKAVRKDLTVMFVYGSQEQKDEADKRLESLKRLIQTMQDAGVETVGGLDKISEKAWDYNSYKESFLFHAAQSLAKKIKKPRSPGEVAMSREVLTKSVQLFVDRFQEQFDVIAYPSSSSTFNAELVKELKRYYTSARVEVLNKLAGKDTDINWEEILERASNGHEEAKTRAAAGLRMPKGYDKLKMTPERRARLSDPEFASLIQQFLPLPPVPDDMILTPLEKEWIEWWTADKVATGLYNLRKSGDKPPSMKALEGMRQDKRYAKLFQGPSQSVEGQRVLVVDDNVAYSATMQILHDLLRQQNPSEIVMFTPFYMAHA